MRELTVDEQDAVSGGATGTLIPGASYFYTWSSGSVGGECSGNFEIVVHPPSTEGSSWDWPFLFDGRTVTDQFEDSMYGIGVGLLYGGGLGAVIGGVGGSTIGGVGVIPGAIGGAVTGAIGGIIGGGIKGFVGDITAPGNPGRGSVLL